MKNEADPNRRLGAREAADYLHVSRSTLAKWRMRGEGPVFHRLGKRLVFYVLRELDSWQQQCDRDHPFRHGRDRGEAGA